jgi:hypothetical protein
MRTVLAFLGASLLGLAACQKAPPQNAPDADTTPKKALTSNDDDFAGTKPFQLSSPTPAATNHK